MSNICDLSFLFIQPYLGQIIFKLLKYPQYTCIHTSNLHTVLEQLYLSENSSDLNNCLHPLNKQEIPCLLPHFPRHFFTTKTQWKTQWTKTRNKPINHCLLFTYILYKGRMDSVTKIIYIITVLNYQAKLMNELRPDHDFLHQLSTVIPGWTWILTSYRLMTNEAPSGHFIDRFRNTTTSIKYI